MSWKGTIRKLTPLELLNAACNEDETINHNKNVGRAMALLQEHDNRISGLRGALDSLLTQVNQMKGMFDDSDGAIAEAVKAAEEALE